MLEYLRDEASASTENGAAAYATTGSDCLDLFATVGALRSQSEGEIIDRFVRAFSEDRDSAVKLLFFARDVRGGLGERRVFRVILRWLAVHEPACVRKNLAYVAEYGRFDDLLVLMGTPCEPDMTALVRAQLEADLEALREGGEVSLLAKWLPSVNASSLGTVSAAKRLARSLGMSDADYRKTLSALRAKIRLIENYLRERDYTFDYAAQPSKALFRYRRAFMRNDFERYSDFLDRVSSGEEKMHADTLAPYEIVEAYLSARGFFLAHEDTTQEKDALNATWASLPDFGTDENALAVIDLSGSMYCSAHPMPAAVALSLGLYFAERNTGCFCNHFITFSHKPRLVAVKGETFVDRLRYASSFSEMANTNIEAVFDLVLSAAVKHRVPQEELPARLIIISDMEFDACAEHAELTVFENAKRRFEAHGYRLPEVVFWNVESRSGHQPVRRNEQGVALVSGCTPRLFSMVAGGTPDPYAFMKEVLSSERYAPIRAD